jgi:hypothetical protein
MAQLHTDELRQNHIIITYDYLRVTFVSFITLCKTDGYYVRQKNERTNESTNENHERAIEFK